MTTGQRLRRPRLLGGARALDWRDGARTIAMNRGDFLPRERRRARDGSLQRERHARGARRGVRRGAATGRSSADDYLAQTAVSDESELGPVIDAVLAANPEQVETYRGGKEGVLGFLVGQVMKETQGKADPKVVNRLLREKLRG